MKTTLKGIKKRAKTWIKKNPNKTLKDYLKKFSKEKKNKIDKLSDQRIDELFTFMITEDMSDKEFKEFTNSWLDNQILVDMMESWDISLKRGALKDYYTVEDKEFPIL